MGKKILVVDDESEYSHMLRHRLESEGYSVEETRFGSQALQLALAGHADLIILDYQMPDERGDTICSSMRSFEKLKDIPIIIVTGHRELDEHFFMSMGATEVIYKPMEHGELVQKVRRYLNR